MAYEEIRKALIQFKKQPELVFGEDDLTEKKLKTFNIDIADILESLKEARLKSSLSKERTVINHNVTLNEMVEKTIAELQQKYSDPSRKRFNLKKVPSMRNITANLTTSLVQKENVDNSSNPIKKRPFSIFTTSENNSFKNPSKIRRTESMKDITLIPVSIPESIQRSISFLQRIQPIIAAVDKQIKKGTKTPEHGQKMSKP